MNITNLVLRGFCLVIIILLKILCARTTVLTAMQNGIVAENLDDENYFELQSVLSKEKLQNYELSRNLAMPFVRPISDIKTQYKRFRKREVDFCREFYPRKSNTKVSSCQQPFNSGLFCDEKNCPYKPSYPNGIPDVKQKLNGTTKNVDIEITWKEPAFGKNNLCGFLLIISSLSHVVRPAVCFQINSKTQFSHVLYGVNFDTKYNITIVSVPAYEDLDRSSKFVVVHVAEKCTIFRQYNMTLPWHCVLPSRVTTTKCINGTIKIPLVKPRNAAFDNFLVMVVPGSRFSRGYIFAEKYGKENERAVISHRLHAGIKFVALVFYRQESKTIHSIASKPFICEGEPTIIKTSQCMHGNVTATWKRVNIRGIRYQVSLYVEQSEGKRKRISEDFKEDTSMEFSELERDTWYTVKIGVQLKSNQIIIGQTNSNRFSCGAVQSRSLTELREPLSLPTIIVLGIIAAIIVVLSAMMYRYRRTVSARKWIYRLRNRRRFNFYREDSGFQEKHNSAKRVLLLYPSGCKRLEKFVMLLAEALGQIGCEIFLDLYKNIEAAEQGGREMYISSKISKADSVIVIFQETNEKSWKIFIGHVKSILKKIIEKTDKSSKYIPISIGKAEGDVWKEMKSRTDPIEHMDSSEKISKLLFRCIDTETYEEFHGIPTQNSPGIDEELMQDLKIWSKRMTEDIHSECSDKECNKGVVETTSVQYDSFINIAENDDYYDEHSTHSLTDSTSEF